MKVRRVVAVVSLPLAYVAGNALGHLITWAAARIDRHHASALGGED